MGGHRIAGMVLAVAPLAALAWFSPPTQLAAVAIATVVLPVVLARGDGSRRRQAGRATGIAFAIVQPLAIAAVLIEPCWLIGLAAALVAAVLVPALLPCPDARAPQVLAPEPGMTAARWLPPLLGLLGLSATLAMRADRPLAPAADTPTLITAAGCGLIWFALTLRPATAIAQAAVMIAVLSAARSAGFATSGMAVAIAQATPLLAWWRRESLGGFAAWAPAAMAIVTVGASVGDPAWAALAVLTLAQWLVIEAFPASRMSSTPPGAGAEAAIAWCRRLHARLEPYWRFYGRAKLAHDPVYRHLAADPRPWARTLDAGCGPGLTASLAVARGGTTRYLGVDLDLDKLLVARRVLACSGCALGERWNLRCDPLPFAEPPDERFDTILLLDVLHYWPDELQAAVLNQLSSLLADDGRLYLREGVAGANGDAGQVERGERFTTFFGLNPENPVRFLSAQRIATLLTAAGLAVVEDLAMGAENRLWVCRPQR